MWGPWVAQFRTWCFQKRLGLGNASRHKHHPHIPMSAKVLRRTSHRRVAVEKSGRLVAMVMAVALAAAVALAVAVAAAVAVLFTERLTLYNQ